MECPQMRYYPTPTTGANLGHRLNEGYILSLVHDAGTAGMSAKELLASLTAMLRWCVHCGQTQRTLPLLSALDTLDDTLERATKEGFVVLD
jgi:hypothetical protein